MRSPTLRLWTLVIMFALAVLLYSLPWLSGRGIGLSFGAYDLAEWASLNPAVRAQTPSLLTTLLLRLPLACATLALAFTAAQDASTTRRLLLSALVVVAAVALLPPFEFLTVARDDPNYRQQAALSAITLVAGLVAVGGFARRAAGWIGAALAVVGAVAALAGLAQALDLLQAFAIPAQVNAAGPLFALTCGAAALLISLNNKRGSPR